MRRNSSSVIVSPTRAALAIVEGPPHFAPCRVGTAHRPRPGIGGRCPPYGPRPPTVLPDPPSRGHAEQTSSSVLQSIRNDEPNRGGESRPVNGQDRLGRRFCGRRR